MVIRKRCISSPKDLTGAVLSRSSDGKNTHNIRGKSVSMNIDEDGGEESDPTPSDHIIVKFNAACGNLIP